MRQRQDTHCVSLHVRLSRERDPEIHHVTASARPSWKKDRKRHTAETERVRAEGRVAVEEESTEGEAGVVSVRYAVAPAPPAAAGC